MTRLGQTFANSAFMTNRLTLILAEGCVIKDQTAWDDHEEIELRLIPMTEIPRLLASGVIENTSAALALSRYLLHTAGLLSADQGA